MIKRVDIVYSTAFYAASLSNNMCVIVKTCDDSSVNNPIVSQGSPVPYQFYFVVRERKRKQRMIHWEHEEQIHTSRDRQSETDRNGNRLMGYLVCQSLVAQFCHSLILSYPIDQRSMILLRPGKLMQSQSIQQSTGSFWPDILLLILSLIFLCDSDGLHTLRFENFNLASVLGFLKTLITKLLIMKTSMCHTNRQFHLEIHLVFSFPFFNLFWNRNNGNKIDNFFIS